MAEGIPTYGGVDMGGARGSLLDVGLSENRTMAEGQNLPNGVVTVGSPHVPGVGTVPTGSQDTRSQGGRGDGGAVEPEATGTGASEPTGLGANVTRLQGSEAVRQVSAPRQQPAAPEQYNIATPPQQPAAAQAYLPNLPSSSTAVPIVLRPPEQGRMQSTTEAQPAPAPVMIEGNIGCATALTSGVVSPATAPALAQLSEQRTALVNALQARAGRSYFRVWGDRGACR